MKNDSENRNMKLILILISLLIVSCSFKEKKIEIKEQTGILIEKNINERKDLTQSNLTFAERQDSLRLLLFNSKSNTNLKSSILQELYLRGLVNQVNDKIEFKLSFDLHGLDCGAPDCYSTDITFDIPEVKPIQFPELVKYKMTEWGCGIEKETLINGKFKLVEQSPNFVNYYSKETKGNLIIIGDEGKLYYFPNTEPNSIRVDLIDRLLENYNDENPIFEYPYQSTIMNSFEYDRFINED